MLTACIVRPGDIFFLEGDSFISFRRPIQVLTCIISAGARTNTNN